MLLGIGAKDAPANAKLQNRLAEVYFEGGRILRKEPQASKNVVMRREAWLYLQKSY